MSLPLKAILPAVLCLVLLPSVWASPISYITEECRGMFFMNGSMESLSRHGHVEISVENPHDVMQYIKMTLSGTSDTTLLSTDAFRAVLASPAGNDRIRLFLNTTEGPQETSYAVTDADKAPLLEIGFDYYNEIGGTDIVPGPNTFFFNVTLNATKPLTGVKMVFQAEKDTYFWGDAMSFFGLDATTWTTLDVIDTDTDSHFDRVEWVGDISGVVHITFRGATESGVNFDPVFMLLDIAGQCVATKAESQTFTGITFDDRFSRGPVRQGVEMTMKQGGWYVRGFLRNVAESLEYLSHNWSIYEIGVPTPRLSFVESNYLPPDETLYTALYETGKGEKAYYTSAFDWEVVWGSSYYSSVSESEVYLPILREIDGFLDKTITIEHNSQGAGTLLEVTDMARHLGHSLVEVNQVRINSVIPALSVENASRVWTPVGVRVYYKNITGEFDITSGATLDTMPSGSADGYVLVVISNLSAVIGHTMTQNDDIIVRYNLTGSSSPAEQNYLFRIDSTLTTVSGTPLNLTIMPPLTVPGVYIAPQPPGPSGPGAAQQPTPIAEIVKELAEIKAVTIDTVNVKVVARVTDTGIKGMRDIKPMVYIPAGSELKDLKLRLFRNGVWEPFTDFLVHERGEVLLENGKYTEFLIEKPPGVERETLDLFDGEKVEIEYSVRIPFGTSYMLTRVSGYNYYEDKTVFEDAWTPFRREVLSIPIDVREGEFIQEESIVGRTVNWIKRVDIHNPNNITVKETLSTQTFTDVLSASLIADSYRVDLTPDDRGHRVSWTAHLKPLESRTYFIKVATPPVVETGRASNVIEADESLIKLALNITFKNFAAEDYSNVSIIVPGENLISVSAGVTQSFDGNSTKLTVPFLGSGESETIQIVYEEKPPLFILWLDKLRYVKGEDINASVLIVPDEKMIGYYVELDISGPDNALVTAYMDMIDTGIMPSGKEATFSRAIIPIFFPSGKYVVEAKLRKEFQTILSDRKSFYLEHPGLDIVRMDWPWVICIAGVISAVAVLRIYKKRGYKDEIDELRRRARGI